MEIKNSALTFSGYGHQRSSELFGGVQLRLGGPNNRETKNKVQSF